MTNKLINTQNRSKDYWLLLKSFMNNKKILPITRLFHENSFSFIIDFKEKVKLVNSFFAKQCTRIRNNSELMTSLTFYRQSSIDNF